MPLDDLAKIRVGVVDYGGGNLRNVLNALHLLGMEGSLLGQARDFDAVDQVLFPGVGAFGDCAGQLDARDLRAPLRDWLRSGRPYFGICLGYQMLFEGSEESPGVEGLGHLAGRVTRFPTGTDLKVPHMGWNEARFRHPEDPLWAGLGGAAYFYFVHSYFPAPEDPSIIACETDYGVRFASGVRQGALAAVQFHPERSQSAGLRLVENFLLSNPVSA